MTFIPSEPVTVKTTTTPPLILSRKRRSESKTKSPFYYIDVDACKIAKETVYYVDQLSITNLKAHVCKKEA